MLTRACNEQDKKWLQTNVLYDLKLVAEHDFIIWQCMVCFIL